MLNSTYPTSSEIHCPRCGKPLLRNEDEAWCHRPCDFGPKAIDEIDPPTVYDNEPNDDETWAFIEERRQEGDEVTVRHTEDVLTIIINE